MEQTLTHPEPVRTKPGPSPATRRFGYMVAILVNVALLIAANNLLAWDIFPFLTNGFERVLPILNVSLGAAIAVNLVYLGFDTPWFKSLTQIGLLAISLVVTIRFYQVFPFDFYAYEFDWDLLAEWALILAMVGVGIGVVGEVVRLAKRTTRS